MSTLMKKTCLALLVAMSFGSGPVLAQTTGAACAAVDDDVSRLSCYDNLFRRGVPAGEGLSVSFESEQLIPARPPGRGPATFTVACTEKVLSVQFRFAGQLLSATGDFSPITFQIDQQTARTRTLNASPDNTALGFWTTGESNAFLASLDGGTNLAVRVTPLNYRSLSVRFSLAGVPEAFAPIRKACE
jgi:hypothetical protein